MPTQTEPKPTNDTCISELKEDLRVELSYSGASINVPTLFTLGKELSNEKNDVGN